MPRRPRPAVVPVLTCVALAVVGCGGHDLDPPADPKSLARPAVAGPPAGAAVAPPVTPDVAPMSSPPVAPRSTHDVAPPSTLSSPSPAGCRADSGWSCTQQQRFAAAGDYVNRKVNGTGYLSVVFTDRQTGKAWRLGPTQHDGWTASTIKLAIATDLLRRQRGGQLTLTAADRHDMATMLNFSDNAASDRLWTKYGGDAMLARFRNQYGMTGLHFVPGFTAKTYWGFVKCTTDDLAALMNYVFTRVDPGDRAYLVGALRGVASNQQWGIWAAGADQRPGNKDGWSYEADPYGKHWVTNTVGFAGPDERYLIAVMYQVDPRGTLADGVHTVSDVVALLFGLPVPARVTIPAPDG